METNISIIIQTLAIVGIGICVYFYLEDQLELALASRRLRNQGLDKKNISSKLFRNLTGATIDDQIIEVLLMISSSLKAGRNLDQAFELVAIASPPPICHEFRTLVQERRLGVSMVEALNNLIKRVPNPDLRLAINATIFQQETGGNLEDLYKQIVNTVAERKKILGKIRAGTAHARLSGSLIAVIPIILIIFLFVMQPTYIMPLFRHTLGTMMIFGSFLASLIGLVIIRRMTKGVLPYDEFSGLTRISVPQKRGLFLTLIKPFTKILEKLNSKVSFLNSYREDVKFLLEAAGYPWEMSADEFIGLQEIFALFLLIIGITIPLLSNNLNILWIVFVLILLPIGFHLPRIYLSNIIRKRQINIEYELPYIIDLLSLAIEAGLDLVGGIQKITERSRPTDIIVEFKTFLADLKMGKSLEEALSDMADRVQVLSFFTFISSLIQAQRLGAEIGPTLRSQAEQMRYQRMILAEEKVNQLPVKLLLPLVFLVFPAIAVLLVGPAILRLSYELNVL